MKSIILRLLPVALITVLFHITASAASSCYNVKINGQQVGFTTSPRMEKGVLMLPVREMFDLFGFEIKWDKVARTVVCTRKDQKIILKEKSGIVQIFGKKISLDVPVKSIEGSIFVPSEVVGQGLGLNVDVVESEGTVCLQTKDGAGIIVSGDGNIVVNGDNVIATISSKYDKSEFGRFIADADKLLSEKNTWGQ